MSVSSLPEWKQLLLERKRREEEERERREKEEEEKLASMPAWKRGIIQRRKRDKDISLQVYLETIVPVHENPFIRTQSSWRKGREADVGNELEVKEKPSPRSAGDAQPGEDRYEQKGGEAAKQREAVAHMQTRPIEAEMGQEEAAEQTSMTARDVRREVSVLKTYPQLPVSVPHSQDDGGEEVTGESTAAASEVTSDRSQKPEDEDEPLKDVEEQLGRHRGQSESTEEEEEEDKGLSQEDAVSYTTPVESAQPLSSSPPLPSSLAAMSRIYNLNTVGSRSALCLRDRTVDVPSSLHLVKVKPLISSSQQGDIKALTGESVCGVQRQIDQFQLKEQEAPKSSTNTSSKDRETKGQQSPKGGLKQQKEEEESPKLKPKDSSSPASSPSVSPSPSPSPKLFTIRSSSGAHVKRGATITVTPKKPAVAAAAPTVRPTPAEPAKGPSQQATPAADEPVKKRYPAVEEIEVIGGYQNLEKSCLVKNKVTPKRGKVCFDEDQLEQVCEYPSENSMLERSERLRGEDEGEGGGGVLLKSIKSVEITTEQRLRVGQCHPLLRKHSV
uniref:Protein phosphatase 1 regulatory subunit 18 n=1 Tax=Kryptolebias marmoratus TaxID=37003 RepID=A0A3Q3AKQ0_KRYMA